MCIPFIRPVVIEDDVSYQHHYHHFCLFPFIHIPRLRVKRDIKIQLERPRGAREAVLTARQPGEPRSRRVFMSYGDSTPRVVVCFRCGRHRHECHCILEARSTDSSVGGNKDKGREKDSSRKNAHDKVAHKFEGWLDNEARKEAVRQWKEAEDQRKAAADALLKREKEQWLQWEKEREEARKDERNRCKPPVCPPSAAPPCRHPPPEPPCDYKMAGRHRAASPASSTSSHSFRKVKQKVGVLWDGQQYQRGRDDERREQRRERLSAQELVALQERNRLAREANERLWRGGRVERVVEEEEEDEEEHWGGLRPRARPRSVSRERRKRRTEYYRYK